MKVKRQFPCYEVATDTETRLDTTYNDNVAVLDSCLSVVLTFHVRGIYLDWMN